MSDLYDEATRHDYIRVPRYLVFLGGGLVAVLFVAVGLWMTVTTEEAVVEPLETVEEAEFKRMAARVAAVRALAPEPELSERRPVRARLTREIADARELAEATATVLSEVSEDEVFSVMPEGHPQGFALSAEFPNREGAGTVTISPVVTISSIDDLLERTARGETRFENTRSQMPDWVPVYPGRHTPHTKSRGIDMGYSVSMVHASAKEIVDWYQDVADSMNEADPSAQAPSPVKTARMGPAGGVRDGFAMKWGDRLVTVVVTEDEFGGSLLVLLYRG